MGAAIKKRRKKKGPKYPESWVYNWLCLADFFLCVSTAQGRTSETLHFLLSQFPPTLSTRAQGFEAHLTSLFNNTILWIVTLDYIIISS